jgi:hypothetical protein
MANISIPDKLTQSQIKALSDKERAKLEAQVTKIVAKGHLIDDLDHSDFSDANDRRIFQIPVFHYEPDVTGLSVRRRSSGVAVRGERGQFAKVLKEAKQVVKSLNAGQSLPAVVSVPTGRPKGRPKLALA